MNDGREIIFEIDRGFRHRYERWRHGEWSFRSIHDDSTWKDSEKRECDCDNLRGV